MYNLHFLRKIADSLIIKLLSKNKWLSRMSIGLNHSSFRGINEYVCIANADLKMDGRNPPT